MRKQEFIGSISPKSPIEIRSILKKQTIVFQDPSKMLQYDTILFRQELKNGSVMF
jgi:energy-coupling factor transporter ATP-binding protein EcfA2